VVRVVTQRARILQAMVEVVAERGFAGASVGLVIARAKVSPRTFYGQFGGLEECFVAVLDEGADRVIGLFREAFERERTWRDGLRSALASLLVMLDSEPVLARVWLVESLAASPVVLEHRERNAGDLLSVIVASWPAADATSIPPLAREGTFASVLGVVGDRLFKGKGAPLIELLGPLMGLAVAPYLDRDALAREIERAQALAEEIQSGRRAWPLPDSARVPAELPALLAHAGAHRARRCLLYIAGHPGASNREVAAGIGIAHLGQVSTLLARLGGLELLAKRAGAPGHPNAWRVTAAGTQAAAALEDQA
jgi:AcrR family transcriptional regulator